VLKELSATRKPGASVFRFPNTDFARSKIDFVELAGIEIPDAPQLGRPMRPSGQVRFVVGKDIEKQLVILEFQLFHTRV